MSANKQKCLFPHCIFPILTKYYVLHYIKIFMYIQHVAYID